MRTALARAAGLLTLSLAMASCGGGTGGNTPTQPDPGTTDRGGLSVSLVGSLPGRLSHVWVTVTGVALHTDANQAYAEHDSTWVRLQPTMPVTVDLVALGTAGGSVSLLSGLGIATGHYAQLRLLLAPTDGTLLPVAGSAGLSHNNEVERMLSDGGTQRLPLETSSTAPSLPVTSGATDIATDTATNLAVQLGAEEAVTWLNASATDGSTRSLLAGQPRAYGLASTGAIAGLVDMANVCGTAGAPPAGSCISKLEAHVLAPSADGSHLEWVRSVAVGASGAIGLYPLPPLAEVEVLVQGQNMRPLLLRKVAVDLAPLTAALLALIGDQTHPLPLSLATAAHTVQLASAAPADVRAMRAVQTLPGDRPRQRAAGWLDPSTGTWPVAQYWVDSDWDSITWDSGLSQVVTLATPQEGAGGGRLLLPASGSTAAQLGPMESAAARVWRLPAAP
ncbi:DUF4382 domain-containing protein [Ideonella azotifigens]|uniref:DUF4382 domain-containing protein n=1 Tax=Ideonella azotifigens TaxID=513160 RepID=A0ABP3VMB1_9BURK|nr:DUF4382 domain-containing protein [Ideonella azotifigens]MCD2338956.1 DUF4382 domain-containing protein [Ideonella azotifigens]